MQTKDLNHALACAEIDESNDTDQRRWSSIAGKKRKERLAMLHGYFKLIYSFIA